MAHQYPDRLRQREALVLTFWFSHGLNFPLAFALALTISTLCSLTPVLANASDILIDRKQITTSAKTINEPTFRDQAGREVYFRGWNVSGSVKLVETGFKPFHSAEDAARSFELMRQHTGANLVRFTLAWEGTHPQVDQIDHQYLDDIVAQLKEAVSRKIYVFLDYHTDLYSRHLFGPNAKFTGNGAPGWIIAGSEYPAATCGLICIAWSQNIITNAAVRLGYRNFFDNASITTDAGQRRVQDEFLWQLRESLIYIKSRLSEEEYRYVLGVQPFNEPIYGLGHKARAEEYDNEKLWPFYQRVRDIMDDTGWEQKWVYAEPMVFWDTNAGFFTPATGGHYLKDKPGPGFVFAPHFYDASRMGITNLSRVENAEYFENLQTVREEANFLGLPTVLGEFGMWLPDQDGGSKDYVRIVKATYQAMEASDHLRPEKDRHLDFYTHTLSGTQWHWDIYKDQHQEYANGNPNRLVTEGDGWNGEDFSAIRGDELTVDSRVIRRAYPRRIQGSLVNFYFNDQATDGAGDQPQWATIKLGSREYFKDNAFAFMTWQSNDSKAPTELFLPPEFNPQNTLIISDGHLLAPGETQLENSQIALQLEAEGSLGAHKLTIQQLQTQPGSMHYVLIVNGTLLDGPDSLSVITEGLRNSMEIQQNPVYLSGKMSSWDYPTESDEEFPIEITSINNIQFFIFRWVTIRWQSNEPVIIFKNNQEVGRGKPVGKKTLWSKVNSADTLRVCSAVRPGECSRVIELD